MSGRQEHRTTQLTKGDNSSVVDLSLDESSTVEVSEIIHQNNKKICRKIMY